MLFQKSRNHNLVKLLNSLKAENWRKKIYVKLLISPAKTEVLITQKIKLLNSAIKPLNYLQLLILLLLKSHCSILRNLLLKENYNFSPALLDKKNLYCNILFQECFLFLFNVLLFNRVFY
jgi:hypothetical protein